MPFSFPAPSAPSRYRTDSVLAAAPAVHVRRGPTLRAHDLLRTFGSGETRTVALQNINLDLERGDLNILMGPSGSGKSTLLAVISALLRPDSGRVVALDEDLWAMSDRDLERFRLKHCSYIFQGYNLFPALSARQQLEVVLQWGEGISQRDARIRSDRVLGQLGLTKRSHLRPIEMSGGEKQRVAIARALVKEPSFLFADEPTSALDWENGQAVIELLRECGRERGATVLVVTHDHRLVPFADKVIEMADGELQSTGDHVFDPSKDTGCFSMDGTLATDREPAEEPVPESATNLWAPVYVM